MMLVGLFVVFSQQARHSRRT